MHYPITHNGKEYTVLENRQFALRVGRDPATTRRWAEAGHVAARKTQSGWVWLWEVYCDAIFNGMGYNKKSHAGKKRGIRKKDNRRNQRGRFKVVK